MIQIIQEAVVGSVKWIDDYHEAKDMYKPTESGSCSLWCFSANRTVLSTHSAFMSSLHDAIISVKTFSLDDEELVLDWECLSSGASMSCHEWTKNSGSFRLLAISGLSNGVADIGLAATCACSGLVPRWHFNSSSTPSNGARQTMRSWCQLVNLRLSLLLESWLAEVQLSSESTGDSEWITVHLGFEDPKDGSDGVHNIKLNDRMPTIALRAPFNLGVLHVKVYNDWWDMSCWGERQQLTFEHGWFPCCNMECWMDGKCWSTSR